MKLNELVETEDQLRSLYPKPIQAALDKEKSQLDEPATEFIKGAPFLCLATMHPDGSADCSPKGDPNGFVKILDSKTIAIPDRKGNNRLDSLVNIIHNPKVGLIFLTPGRNETLRVNGHAKICTDEKLLAMFEVDDPKFKGRLPTTAIVVSIDEVYFHCPKALIRSQLWKPAEKPSLKSYIRTAGRVFEMDLTEEEIARKADEYEQGLSERLY